MVVQLLRNGDTPIRLRTNFRGLTRLYKILAGSRDPILGIIVGYDRAINAVVYIRDMQQLERHQYRATTTRRRTSQWYRIFLQQVCFIWVS